MVINGDAVSSPRLGGPEAAVGTPRLHGLAPGQRLTLNAFRVVFGVARVVRPGFSIRLRRVV